LIIQDDLTAKVHIFSNYSRVFITFAIHNFT